ncbi:MAG: indole-3-glycerol phosphate synthase TrpC [Endozoicomonadaceae bacterium]|nr:indole-3-glycerol phosphate synthase TrpC [Endozoicomonadaceae bacterium]
MSDCPDILKKIIEVKKAEIIVGQKKNDLETLKEQACVMSDIRPFKERILTCVSQNKAAIIAELKKASPSKGLIRDVFDPEFLATSYEKGGATCLSILTDQSFFQGHSSYIQRAKKVTQLPVLRKDFIIDPWQIYESRVMGADCILLIVSALTSDQLHTLYALALDIGLDVLIEVHDEAELALALPLSQGILGINNRNLHTFETTLSVTYNLLQHIPDERVVVTESGIVSKQDIIDLFDHQVKAFLIGESFMQAEDPGAKLFEFFEHYLS